MIRAPAWALLSAGLAPISLVAGFVIGAAVQPPGYDAIEQTISALAAHGAAHRWIMTAGLAVLGLGHVVTATGLRGARRSARLVLGAAGLATLGVARFAEPAHGSSTVHAACATAAFVLLAAWPATLVHSGAVHSGVVHSGVVHTGIGWSRPWPQRRRVALGVSLGSFALLVWFAVTVSHGPIGISERVLSTQQALWPLVVVATARRQVGMMGP